MTKYNLRDEIRSVLDGSSLSDPGEIADKVAGDIPSKSLRACLRVTLRSFVREVIRSERSTTTVTDHGWHDAHRTPVGDGSTSPGDHPADDAHDTYVAGGDNSWKRRGIRDNWRAHLRDRYHTGDGWKQLAAMTPEDLRAAAAERQEIAERNLAQQATLNAWADECDAHEAETFGDLPEATQAHLLGGAA